MAIVWAVACVFLGRWQWHRFEGKKLSQHQLNDNYNADPVGITSILPTQDAVLSPNDTWKQVALHGSYLAAKRILVRNRPNDGYYGYEVVIPFRQTNGTTVLVDRGWINNGPTAEAPSAVPETPPGEITVVGWLRPGEPMKDKRSVPGQVNSIDLHQISGLTGQQLLGGAYVLMRTEKPAAAVTRHGLAPLPKPTPGDYAGVNLSYALQWWFGAAAGLVFYVVRLRREELESDETHPVKPKKVRIWDEEDE
ncbi:SURF1 family protein [Flexivirga caeni]|uniref:SURF1 family cytochrome oxidase biogenesis protein n=1 Tax=Flexivirga caeni TaxID=2294115 RepID=UPI0013156C0E|nr:SURF1 family protein [Flexivirga caeni]